MYVTFWLSWPIHKSRLEYWSCCIGNLPIQSFLPCVVAPAVLSGFLAEQYRRVARPLHPPLHLITDCFGSQDSHFAQVSFAVCVFLQPFLSCTSCGQLEPDEYCFSALATPKGIKSGDADEDFPSVDILSLSQLNS